MSISITGLAPLERLRITRGTLFYLLCLSIISVTYYLYWWQLQLKIYYIGWGICLLIALAMLAANHLRWRHLGRDLLPVVVWFAYLLMSALWSPSPSTTLYFWWADLVNIVAFLVSYSWARSTSEWELSGFFELQAFLVLPIVLFFLLTHGELYPKGFGSIRTVVAASCLLSLPFLIWRYRIHSNPKTLGILLVAIGLLLGGGSRTALLVTPVLLIGAFFSVPQTRRTRSRSVAMIFAILIAIVFALVLVPAFRNSLLHSVGRFAGGSQEGTSLSISSAVLDEIRLAAEDRVDIERRLQLFIVFESFLTHPIFGAGYQSTLAIIRNRFGWEVGAHGLPATLLGETGLVGTAIFFWIIARFYRRINFAGLVTRDPVRREFLSTCKLTMLGILLLGLFHQVHEMPATFALLAWGYSTPRPG